jgi:iron complex outermembrane recepter protein
MRLSVVVAALCVSLVGLVVADDVRASIRKSTNIPAQSLGSALEALAKDRNFQLVYVSEDLNELRTHGAVGEFTSEEALRQLLTGTGMTFRYLDENTVTIVRLSSTSTSAGSAPADTTPTASTPDDSQKEGKKSSSEQFRVAQADQGQVSSPATVEKESEQSPKKVSAPLEEVVVTGSRIPVAANDGPVAVKIITREQIETTGATSIAQVLNSLPEVSNSSTGSTLQNNNPYGSNSVQLRGLPTGTTLILINGQRTGVSAAGGGSGFFNIAYIPLAAVERIEVVPTGSSAVYGGDALAGVVNIVLKNNFEGMEANVNYGHADETGEVNANAAWGWKSENASLDVIGAYHSTSPLAGTDRAITSSGNFMSLGGPDFRQEASTLADIYSLNGQNLPGLTGMEASVPAGSTGVGLTPAAFRATTGIINTTFTNSTTSLISDDHRFSGLVSGRYQIAPTIELFSDILYTHTIDKADQGLNAISPTNGPWVVSSSNPFNPFGVDVGVGYVFNDYDVSTNSTEDFIRPVVGVRGGLLGGWSWELSSLISSDQIEVENVNYTMNSAAVNAALGATNPAQALNVFKDGPGGSPQLLNTFFDSPVDHYKLGMESITGFVRGPIAHLESGNVETVFGGQAEWSNLNGDFPEASATYSRSRRNYGLFTEARVPIIANLRDPAAGDVLVLQGALRYDSYSDFGSRTTPQIAVELRPVRSLMLRASYSTAFKPPLLNALAYPVTTYPNFLQFLGLIDPLRGGAPVTGGSWIIGGNPNLKATTGDSRSIGAVFTPNAVPGLTASITNWAISFKNQIGAPPAQFVIDNAANLPGRVIRGPPQNGEPGPILSVDSTFINYGSTDTAGFDLDADWKKTTPWGEFSPAIGVTNTYRYNSVVSPGAPTVSLVSVADFSGYAPRWKGVAAFGWKPVPELQFTVYGHYVSSYQDYQPLQSGVYQTLGDFWTYDANIRYDLREALRAPSHLSGLTLTVGVVNAFNKLPVYSTYFIYDPTQYDIRGRFVYAEIEAKL